MLTKPEATRGTWTGLGILALGIALGALARPSRWFEARRFESSRGTPREPFPALVPSATPGRAPDNGLATLELVIPDGSAAVLERVRASALEQGIITQDESGTVPAEVVFDGEPHAATLRIKGDWTDHVEGERWSYRIRLDASSFRGMREFSIQAPETRGYLWEWLVHEAARREHVLVPRSTFLNVVQNGHAMGVYFLEEHFEKELLESQGRREGPIVVWDESTLWSTLLQEGNVPAKGIAPLDSALTAGAHEADAAEVRAFGEKRLSSLPGLEKGLHAALEQMKALRAMAVADQPEVERLRALEAIDELRGRTLEDLVDADRLGCAHALLSVFQSEHALAWHNMRFYRDPVQARLEPILFDCAVREPSSREPVPWRATDLAAAFALSPGYQAALFTHLGRMLRSDWLDGFFADVGPDLARFEAAIRAGETLPPGCSADEMKQRLRAQVLWLRRACLPDDGVNFECEYEVIDAARNAGAGWLEVRTWATTRSPVVLEGFRFSNGSFSPAAGALQPTSGARLRGAGVILPSDGRVTTFRLPMDERLANLETVEKVTRAIRDAMTADQTLDLDVRAVHRLLAMDETREELLAFRRHVPASAGRPEAPALEEALERHRFLRFDFARRELTALPGTWDVAGDLVLPSEMPLRLGPATTLRFQPGAVLLADAPLFFEGTGAAPVVLERAGDAPWAGVIVLGADGRSAWTEVTVRGTTAAVRGGWMQTGAVTFYRSPVTMLRCRFEGTEAEDGLNIFGADILLDGVELSGCRSDSFDGDFVTGEIRNCVFRDGQADGLDVSGADVLVVDCRFERLGDKGLSIGERSKARIQGGHALDVGIGVASKDASEVEVSGLAVEARYYALAAFVKKPEYGPSRLVARALDVRRAGIEPAFAQTGCTLEIDGVLQPTHDIDVEASYEAGVLGHAK
jgi:CotH protein